MRFPVCLIVAFWIVSGVCPGQSNLPNIVIILADDLGYGDPGCYNDQSLIPTPNMDQLANQGMKFSDAHSPSSVCTPTRYGLLTGRYCWRTKLKRMVLWPWDPPLLESERLTLPEMLQQKGYTMVLRGIAMFALWFSPPGYLGCNSIFFNVGPKANIVDFLIFA